MKNRKNIDRFENRENKRRLLLAKQNKKQKDNEILSLPQASGVLAKTLDFNKRIIASIVALAIVLSCVVVGINIATKAEGEVEPASSMKPVTMDVRLNGQDGYTTATVPAGVIEDNKSNITIAGAMPEHAVLQKAILVDHESNTETEIARVAKYKGNTYYSLDKNDSSGTLLLATQDLVLVYAEKFEVTYNQTGNGSFVPSSFEENGHQYIWGGEDLTIQCNPSQDYYTGRIEYQSNNGPTNRVAPNNNYVTISAKDITGNLAVTIPFVYIEEYSVNDARYMSNSKYYPELKNLDNHGGISTNTTTKDQNLRSVSPDGEATFYLFSQANSTNSKRYLLNMLAINGVDIQYPKEVNKPVSTPYKDGGEVTVTLLRENNEFEGETSWPNEKPRTIYEIKVSHVHENIEVAYYFKNQYDRELIIKGLHGIDQTAYAAEDTNAALVTRYYSFVQDEIYKNVYTAYYTARGFFTDINWFPSDNLVLYTVKPGFNPYKVSTVMYYDDVEATGIIRDAPNAGTPVDVIKAAGSAYDDAGRYNTSHRYWGSSKDTALKNRTTETYIKRTGMDFKTTDLLLTTLSKRNENWFAVALSQNESNNQQLYLNAPAYEYHIECDLNGGSIDQASEGYTKDNDILVSEIFTMENGEVYTALPSVVPTRSGKRFLGWQMVDDNGNNIAGGFYKKNAQFIIGKDTVDKAIGDKTENEGQTFKFVAVWQDDATADTTTVSVAIYQEVLSEDDQDAEYDHKDGKIYKLVNYSEEEQHTAQTTVVLDRHEPAPATAYKLNDELSKLETVTVPQTSSEIPRENRLTAYHDFNLVTLDVSKQVYGRPNTKAFSITVKLTPDADSIFKLEQASDFIQVSGNVADINVADGALVFTALFEDDDATKFEKVPYGWNFEVSEAINAKDYTSVIRNGRETSEDNQPLSGTLTGDTEIVVENSKLNDDKNVETDKWLTKNDDGTYKLTMEAYATGQTVVDEVLDAVPTDYVLILDQSGSMAAQDMPDGYRRFEKQNWTCNDIGLYKESIDTDIPPKYVEVDGKYYKVLVKDKPTTEFHPITGKKIRDFTSFKTPFQTKTLVAEFDEEHGVLSQKEGHPQEVYFRASDGAYYRVYNTNRGLLGRYETEMFYTDAYGNRQTIGTYMYQTPPIINQKVPVTLYTNSTVSGSGSRRDPYVVTPDVDHGYSLWYVDENGEEHQIGNGKSGQMDGNVYSGPLYTPRDNIKRRDALERAAKNFVDIIEYQAEEYSVDHKVAVVGFSSVTGADNTEVLSRKSPLDEEPESSYHYLTQYFPKHVNFNGDQYNDIQTDEPYENALLSVTDSAEKEYLTAAIEGVTAAGGTNPEYGFYMADNVFEKRLEKQYDTSLGTKADRNTVIVFFTDGAPGDTSTTNQIDKANLTVNAAHVLKEKGTKVFTIGIFSSGDNQPLTYTQSNSSGDDPWGNDSEAPDNFVKREESEDDGLHYFYFRGNGSSYTNHNDTIADYMEVVSSKYPNATDFYVQGELKPSEGARNRGNINTDARYYTNVSDASDLSRAFEYVSQQAGPTVNTVSLDASNSVLRDIITDDFDATNATISVYTEDAVFNENDVLTGWSNKTEVTSSVRAAFDPDNPKVLNVENYNYSEHYVSSSNKDKAQKIIVELNGVKPTPTSTGGIFDSNTGDSGIYKKTTNEPDKLIDAFPIPHISRYKYNVIVDKENKDAHVGVDFTMTADEWSDSAPIAKDSDSSILTFTPTDGSDTQQWKPNSNEDGAKNGDYIIFEEILKSENNSGVIHNDNIPDEYSLATVVTNPDTSGDYEYTIYIDGKEVPLDENNATAQTDLPQRDADIVIRSSRVMQQVMIRKLTRTEGSEDNFADWNRKFDIKVKLLDQTGADTSSATYDDVEFDSTGTATLKLAHSQMKLFNIPNNYRLVISEDADPYVTSYVVDNGEEQSPNDGILKIEEGIQESKSILVYNTIQAPVITGIYDNDDSINVLLIIVSGIAVIVGVGYVYIRRRRIR